MAESTAKNQPKRKRANKKEPAVDDSTVPETDYLLNEQGENSDKEDVDSIIKKIKSEVDDTDECLNESQTNLAVIIGDLKKEDYFDDDSGSSQSVPKSKSIEKDNTNEGKQSNLGESSSSLLKKDSTNSKSGNKDTVRNKAQIISDTEDSSNDVTEVNGESTSKVLPKKENVRRYPFSISESDYLKFTQAALSRNFNLNVTDNEGQSSETAQSEENEADANKDEVEVKSEPSDENIDLEALQQARLERLNKLNEAVDFIKDVLAKFAEKESVMQIGQEISTSIVKSEREEIEDGVEVIKEEEGEIKNDVEMETADVTAV